MYDSQNEMHALKTCEVMCCVLTFFSCNAMKMKPEILTRRK